METTTVKINGQQLPMTLHHTHTFLMDTKTVAAGFGVNDYVIRDHKRRQADELIEGKHWISSVGKSHAGNPTKTSLWTKRGIVRLGFFIKSERAKQFRDWAEDYIIEPKGFAARAEAERSFKAQEAARKAAELCTRYEKTVGVLYINNKPHYPLGSTVRFLGGTGMSINNKKDKGFVRIGNGKKYSWYMTKQRFHDFLTRSRLPLAPELFAALFGTPQQLAL